MPTSSADPGDVAVHQGMPPATRSRERREVDSPLSLEKALQTGLGFWPRETGSGLLTSRARKEHFLWFQATNFVKLCYNSPRKLIE